MNGWTVTSSPVAAPQTHQLKTSATNPPWHFTGPTCYATHGQINPTSIPHLRTISTIAKRNLNPMSSESMQFHIAYFSYLRSVLNLVQRVGIGQSAHRPSSLFQELQQWTAAMRIRPQYQGGLVPLRVGISTTRIGWKSHRAGWSHKKVRKLNYLYHQLLNQSTFDCSDNQRSVAKPIILKISLATSRLVIEATNWLPHLLSGIRLPATLE